MTEKRSWRNNRKTVFIKNYKGQDIRESHGGHLPETKRYIDEEKLKN